MPDAPAITASEPSSAAGAHQLAGGDALDAVPAADASIADAGRANPRSIESGRSEPDAGTAPAGGGRGQAVQDPGDAGDDGGDDGGSPADVLHIQPVKRGRRQGAKPPEGWEVVFHPEPCTRLGGSGCARCAAVCPVGAIRFGRPRAAGCGAGQGSAQPAREGGASPAADTAAGAPLVDAASCIRCGICIGICDGFSSSAVTTVDYAERMVRAARRPEAGGRIYLCCGEDLFEGLQPAANVFAPGCLSALSPEFMAYLLSCGIEVVLCHDLAYCEGCATGGRFGGKLWQRAFELVQGWTGRRVGVAEAIPETRNLARAMAAPDRRSLFTGIIGAAGEVASGEYRARKSTVVDDFLARRERARAHAAAAPGGGAFLDEEGRRRAARSHFARESLMAAAMANDPGIAARRDGAR